MAEQQTPSQEPIPSTDREDQNLPAESVEPTLRDLDARASTTTTLLQAILADGDDRLYVRHWGINE